MNTALSQTAFIIILISLSSAQQRIITKCIGSAMLNFNIIRRGPQEIHMTDLSANIKSGQICDAKTCGDWILQFYKSFTHDFDLTKPSTEMGDTIPIGQYICDTIAMDFTGYLTLNEDYFCSNSDGKNVTETVSRVESPYEVNVCCKNSKFALNCN